MSTRDEQITQPVLAPTITFPEEGSNTGPVTLMLGSGIPDALVQVCDSAHTYTLGSGQVSANGRWAFTINGAQPQGLHGIQARQTFDGVTSDWSEVRKYNVRLRPDIDAPVVFEPREGEPADAVPEFSGDVTQAAGFVSIFNLDTGLEIARADVDSDGLWHTQVIQPLAAGQYRTSAVHNIGGKVSDWGRVRTFTVSANGTS
ncbi:hypothetical protein J3P75_21000 [Pseudomonas sp. R1-1]|uniref:hypothetical protein n=1 Tax=Pseudomonas sp. R1-1 TaxID=1602529 RepID=UPI003DA90540